MKCANSYADIVTVENIGNYIGVVGGVPFYSFLCNFSDNDISLILKSSESKVSEDKSKYLKCLSIRGLTPYNYLFKYAKNCAVSNIGNLSFQEATRLEEKLLIAYGFYLAMTAALQDTKVRYLVCNRRGTCGIVEDWLKGWADEVISNKTIIDYFNLKAEPNVYARGVKVCNELSNAIMTAQQMGCSNHFLDNLTKLKCIRERRDTIWGAAVADLLTNEISGRINDGWAKIDILSGVKPSGALQKGEKIPKPIITTRALKERLGIK